MSCQTSANTFKDYLSRLSIANLLCCHGSLVPTCTADIIWPLGAYTTAANIYDIYRGHPREVTAAKRPVQGRTRSELPKVASNFTSYVVQSRG